MNKFSLEEVLQETPAVVNHDLNLQLNKRRRGGKNEANAIKRAELAAFETILRQLREINERLARLEK